MYSQVEESSITRDNDRYIASDVNNNKLDSELSANIEKNVKDSQLLEITLPHLLYKYCLIMTGVIILGSIMLITRGSMSSFPFFVFAIFISWVGLKLRFGMEPDAVVHN